MTDQEIRAKALECGLSVYRSEIHMAAITARNGKWRVETDLWQWCATFADYIRNGPMPGPRKAMPADLGLPGTWPDGEGK